MSDDIGVSVSAGGAKEVKELISALQQLNAQISTLGANNSLQQLSRQMELMQASMTTGFAEMAALARQSGQEQVAERVKSNDKLLREQAAFEAKQHASANKFHDKVLTDQIAFEARQAASANKFHESVAAAEAMSLAKQKAMAEKQQYDLAAIRAKADQNAGSEWEKFLEADRIGQAKQRALAEKQQYELAAIRAKADQLAGAEWEKFLAADRAGQAKQKAMAEKQQVELAAIRAKADQQAGAEWEKFLAVEKAGQMRQLAMAQEQQYKLYAIKEAGLERERSLNTAFLTSSLATQLATAEKAAVYSSMGGNAASKYGSSAAGADIAALRQQYERLPQAIRESRNGIDAHNAAMNEAHALARGLAGSLGGLWLTYGSLVPLAAGAAIAASLKNIVTAGKEVEYQLKFVEALGGGQVNLDSLLHITDVTVVSIKEAAEGMRALAQNGLNAADSLKVLPSILNLAVIGELSVSNAALAATGTVSAFGLSLSDLDRVANIFAQAAATSNTSVAAMTESMKQASTVAAIYGATVEETAAALGVLAKVNITGTAAGTAYTNMLTNLYTPTAKAAKAMEELGLSADDGNGGLKDSTVLLGELRNKLAAYNDLAKASFLGDIFTVRGQKGASTLLTNWDDYIRKIQEAKDVTDFMGVAVSKLEDSTTGSFKRLSNSVNSSLDRAFKDSAPALQSLVTHLAEVAKQESTVKFLTGLADATLRLTTFIMDHIGALTLLTTAYIALRVAAALLPATIVMAERAVLGFTVTLKSAVAGLGWLALGITAAITVYELFIAKTTDVEKADQRRQNSIQTTIEYLDREIERLTERNRLWNPETKQFDNAPAVAGGADAVSQLRAGLTQKEAELASLRASARTLSGGGERGDLAVLNNAREQQKLSEQILKLNEQLVVVQGKLRAGNDLAATDKSRRADESVVNSLSSFIKQNDAYRNAPDNLNYNGNDNPVLVDLAAKAKDLRKQFQTDKISAEQAITQFNELKVQASRATASRDPKEDKKGNNDAFRAEMERLTGLQAAAADRAKTELANLESAYSKAEISSLDRYARERDVKVADYNLELDLSVKKENLARTRENSTAIEMKNRNAQAATNRQILEAEANYERQVSEEIHQAAMATTKYKIDELKKQGKMTEAYQLENGDRNNRLDQNIGTVTSANVSAWQSGDPAAIARTSAQLQVLLDLRKQYVETFKEVAQDEGMANATKAFSSSLTQLQVQLDDIASQSTEGSGLGAIFTNALASQQAYAAALPGLITQQQQLQALATNSQRPEDQKKATSALGDLNAQATRMRKMWTDVGGAIEKALTGAFGKGGTALGRLITLTMSYKDKQKDINAELAKNPNNSGAQLKAAQDLASAQLSAYGDMAGAAKGFFDEQSKGYKALDAVQKVFYAAQMVMALKDMATKLFATGTVMTAKATANTAEVVGAAATVPVVVGAEGAKQGAYGITALAAALAAPPPANFVAFAAVAAMLAAIGVAVSGGGGGGPSLSEQRQKANGTGTILGDPTAKSESISKSLELVASNTFRDMNISSGMLASLRNIESSIGGLGNLLIRSAGVTGSLDEGSLGGAQSAFNSILGNQSIGEKLSHGIVGKVIGSIFGGKTTVLDTGLTANRTTLGALEDGGKLRASQYSDTKKDGGIFHSDKYRTNLKALDQSVGDQFSLVVKGLADGVTAAAGMLGWGGKEFTDHLNAFVVDIGKITLKDLTGDEIQKALETAFSKMGDDMATFATGNALKDFQQAGEGMLETLVRVGTEYATVDAVLASMDKTFGAVGLSSIAARENLIELSGGLDKFTEQGSFFLENFFTDKEKADTLRKTVNNQIAPIANGTPINTLEDFKKLALAQDLSTDAGAKAYTTLMGLAQAFKQLTDYGDAAGNAIKTAQDILEERQKLQDQLDELTMTSAQLREKERATLDASNRALYDQIHARQDIANAYETESQALQDTIDRLTSFQDSIREFRESLVTGDLSDKNPLQKAAEAQRQYEETLALARSGDTKAQDKLAAAAQAYLEADRVIKAGSDGYTTDLDKVKSDMSAIDALIGSRITDAQKQFDLLKSQVDWLTTINQSTISVKDAIAALSAAMRADGKQDPMLVKDGSHAAGLVSVPFDGYMAQTHAGEAIVDAASMASFRRYFGAAPSTGDSGKTDAILQALREDNQLMREKLEEVAIFMASENRNAHRESAGTINRGTSEAAKEAAYADQLKPDVR